MSSSPPPPEPAAPLAATEAPEPPQAPPAPSPEEVAIDGADEIDADAWVGRIVDERYRVTGLIGVGGMAAVFAAEHIRLGHAVALKVLLPRYLENDEIRARFAREALAMARLDHPHIASATDYGELEDGGRYMLMPLVPGRSLGDLLYEGGKLSWRESCVIGAQIADALASAHEAEVVHRDLKPDNVMLAKREDGGLRSTVLDFGIAKVRSLDADDPERSSRLRTLTRVGHVMGTPGYMAPEQATGQPVDATTDLYALGLIVYECLTGEAAYSGQLSDILTEQLTKPPPSLLRHPELDAAPRELDALIAKLLAAKSDERPSSASAVRDAFLELAYGSSGTLARASMATGSTAGTPLPPLTDAAASEAAPRRAPSLLLAFGAGVLSMVLLAGGGLAIHRATTADDVELDTAEVPAALSPEMTRLFDAPALADRRAAAAAILAFEPRDGVPAWLDAAAQLQAARSCDDRAAALAHIQTLGDRRARPTVERMHNAPTRGCGRRGRSDCYACVREELAATLNTLNERE